ncbi:MAG: hypothetical protein JWR83_794 [Aeromicrobium sp.]|nr:hypothetical protein [Aeromicrobium sp.]
MIETPSDSFAVAMGQCSSESLGMRLLVDPEDEAEIVHTAN